MGLFSRVRELEAQNKDLNRRLECVEEYMYDMQVDKLLKEYSEKYNIKIQLSQNIFNKRYYLSTDKGEVICYLDCFNGKPNVYSEIYRSETKIKAFLYDREKGEKDNVKE